MLLCSTITISKQFVRNYIRKIEPIKITDKQKKLPVGVLLKRSQRKREEALDSQKFDEEISAEVDCNEPELDLAYLHRHGADLHNKEMEAKTLRGKQHKIIRKHFRPLLETQKEISILTYAEKQTIKYLHELDPEEWTVERLALSFPITQSGVQKLLKTQGARMKTEKEIQEHDQRVVKNLEKIKSGQFPISPEFEEKLNMRKMMPMKVGDVSSILEEGLVKVNQPEERVIGEFERLIIENGPDKNITAETFTNFSTSPKADANLNSRITANPDEREEFKHQLGLRPNQLVTLDQFEAKIRKRKTKIENIDLPPDELERVNVLLNIPKSSDVHKVNPVDSKEIMQETTMTQTQQPTIEDYLSGSVQITKYKKDLKEQRKDFQGEGNETGTNDERIEVKVERGKGYIYDESTKQYQKPFINDRPLKIQISESQKQNKSPDSIYKVGDAYYNENGDFLYRVI